MYNLTFALSKRFFSFIISFTFSKSVILLFSNPTSGVSNLKVILKLPCWSFSPAKMKFVSFISK